VLTAGVLGGVTVAALLFRSGRCAGAVGPTDIVQAKEVQLGSRVGGRVATVHVKPGQRVEAGQVLVTLEARELQARRDQAKSRLVAARAAMKRAVSGPSPEEIAIAKAAADVARARLERVKAGPRREQLRKAQAELDAARVERKHAGANFARAKGLLREAAISQAEYDAALAARDQARHRVSAAQAALDMVAGGSRPEEVAEAKAELDRAQAHYERFRRGAQPEERDAAQAAVDLAQAQLAEAEAALGETVLTAAERCVIKEVKVRPGSVISAGQPVIVANMEPPTAARD
jgi:HlyD family secretion protein